MVKEITIQQNKNLPFGYKFVAKGDQYVTRSCTKAARDNGQDIFIIMDGKTRQGIGIPRKTYNTVMSHVRQSAQTRKNNREQVHTREVIKAMAEIAKQYPKIPGEAVNRVLKAWDVYSGRVGRTSKVSMGEKVRLAVTAVARHAYTGYDALLRGEVEKDEARRRVWQEVRNVLAEWSGKSNGPKGGDGGGKRGTLSKIVIKVPEQGPSLPRSRWDKRNSSATTIEPRSSKSVSFADLSWEPSSPAAHRRLSTLSSAHQLISPRTMATRSMTTPPTTPRTVTTSKIVSTLQTQGLKTQAAVRNKSVATKTMNGPRPRHVHSSNFFVVE